MSPRVVRKCPRLLISFLSRIVIEETRKRCKKQPVQCGFNPSDNAYGPLKLMHTVIEVINEVCLNYKSSLNVQNRQNMAVSYPLPAPEDVYSVVSTSALKNMRRKMEDRLIVVHDLNTIFTKQDTTPSHYYAVFDGHGGEHAAAYSANHLHQYLAESTNFTSNPEQAIQDAFSKTDSMFIKKCETEKIDSGTTAVCALLLPKEKTLYVAWVGDSQAALVSGGRVRSCVEPHRPDRQDERQRIVDEGGTILHWGVWRVNGKLSVSRAIGDADYKPYVSATPDIVKIPLGGEEDFLILASDGLWDHLTKIKTAKVVYEALYFSPERAQTISRDLVDLAKRNGSTDNISVIVVFLRDPHQIASGLRWDNRLVIMDTLDNANNPFAIPNKTNNVDRITGQNDDDLLLNFADELKKDDIPNNDLIKMLEKSNCGRLTPDFDKDNLGPETNVDVPDDGPPSPNFDQMKRPTEALDNNQNCSNPFNDIEKSLELNLNLKAGTFEGLTSPTVEECVPPANSVHNVSQLIDAGAESDSEEDEEEWNYVRGEEAHKENANPLPLSSQVAEEEEEDIDNAMSQLNPNAAEFIPSPARVVASPLGRLLDEDQVLSRSPKKPPPTEVDINVPNQRDFEKDISLKPHEIEEAFSNGHQDAINNETNAINALNSRLDEFHFGPNAAPFTPAKLLDQSETSSTRANYGDESELGVSFNDSMLDQDQNDFVQKDDPMSMSFHQDRSDDSNLFDLNKVHVLPENVDEFIAKEDKANSLFDDTISDLTEHFPLGEPEEKSKLAETEFTTDLDHEDKNIEQLDINQSSTPIEDRSQSPSDTQTSVDDDRVLSPREEIRTPVEEPSQASPVEECKIPKVEEHLEIPDREETRSKSPNEQNRLCSPFEDEHLISPVEEHKSPSPYEEKEMYSTQEEKDVCSPVEENDVCCLISKLNEPRNDEKDVYEEKDLLSEKDIIQEERYMEEKQLLEDVESVAEKEVIEEKEVVEPQRENFSPVEAIASPDSTRDIISPVQERQLYSPEDEVEDSLVQEKEISPSDSEMDTAPIAEETVSSVQERIVTPEVERQVASPLQDGEITSQVTFERDMTSPTQEEEIVSSGQDLTSIQEKDIALSPQEECLLVRETVESPSLEQEVSTAEIDEDNYATVEPSIGELPTEPVEVTTTCDNLESPQQEPEPVASEPSPKDEEFLKFETEKSDEVKAKENVENLLQLDSLNTVPTLEEKCPSPAPPENESLKADSVLEINDESGVQLDQSEDNSKAEFPSFVSAEQSVAPLLSDVDTTNADFHSQETLEAVENSIDVSNIQCSLNKSAADTSSINTASFLERSLFEEVKCPISPNLSVKEPTVTSSETSSLLKTEESINISQSSPVREQQPDLSKVTSTPVADKLEVVKALTTEAKSPADDKTSKVKEADKKPATKSKVTSSTTAKKVPPTKSSLAPTKTTTKPSPKPAAKPISKTNTTASKVNSTSKTESAVSKVANKSSTSVTSKANTTTTARVPLSSRTTTTSTTNKTNGTAKPATKLSAGTIKKSTEGSSMKSATSTGQSKTTSTTARSTLASARSATSTAAPKQRPSTLKSAATKTVDAPKPTTARTTTAPRVPLTSRPAASKTSSSLVNKDVKDSAGRTISKPRSATEKQVKETANKLTAASRAVSKTTSTIQSLAKTTTVTKKSEVTGTRTATSRTTTTSKAPIKKPSETNKTATTTKVGKPKMNGVAPVVNEKIIVNNAPKELNSNGDQQFVKDNSPVDNKLITDQLSESATN